MPGLLRVRNSGARRSFHEKLCRIYIPHSGISSFPVLTSHGKAISHLLKDLFEIQKLGETYLASCWFLFVSFLYILLMQTRIVYPCRNPRFRNMAFYHFLQGNFCVCFFCLNVVLSSLIPCEISLSYVGNVASCYPCFAYLVNTSCFNLIFDASV